MRNRDNCANGFEGETYIQEGLTKLECAAIAAMQGLLSCDDVQGPAECAKWSIKYANALFDELEKGQ